MAESGDGSQQGPREGRRSQAMSAEWEASDRSRAGEGRDQQDSLNLSQPTANVFQTFPTIPRASSKSRNPQVDAEGAGSSFDGGRRVDPSSSSADDVFPNPYFPVKKPSASRPSPSRNPSLTAGLGELSLAPSSAASSSTEIGSSSALPPPVGHTERSTPRASTSSAVFPVRETRRGSQSSRSSRSEPKWDRPLQGDASRRESVDSIGAVLAGRRESEASVATISGGRSGSSDKSASPPPPSEPRKGPVFPINKNAKFQSIHPVRTSRYKPPESTGSASPPSSIASSQHSASSAPPKQRASRPPPIVTSSTSSTMSSGISTSDSKYSLRSSSASIRSSNAPSFRSSAPSTMTTSTRLSDGPQSIFANPEHKTRPITDLVSLPRFFKKRAKAPAGPIGRVGGSASILDAALSTSQTWSNPGRAPPTGQRSSSGRSSSSVNSDALLAAMAKNPRRASVTSDVSSLAPSELAGAGGQGYSDGGGGMRTDVFATKPRPKAAEQPAAAQVQGLGLQGM